ncbi:unnamed protein product [Amoebophrya sp. A120]|nr:unnamed protein product [Amoebophrya sp. A120]|eukprot:GSA120T00021279001.1
MTHYSTNFVSRPTAKLLPLVFFFTSLTEEHQVAARTQTSNQNKQENAKKQQQTLGFNPGSQQAAQVLDANQGSGASGSANPPLASPSVSVSQSDAPSSGAAAAAQVQQKEDGKNSESASGSEGAAQTSSTSSAKAIDSDGGSSTASPGNKEAAGEVENKVGDKNSAADSSSKTDADKKKKEEPTEPNTFWKELHQERVLLILLPIAIFLAVVFERAHRKWLRVNFSLELDRPHVSVDNSLSGLTHNLFQTAVSLSGIYFKHPAGKIKGLSYILMLVCHNCFGKYIDVQFFSFTARFWDFYQHPSLEVFQALILNWLMLHTAAVLTSVYSVYIEKMLKLHWREHMTVYFEKIWLPRNYEFSLRDDKDMDNPDQRIQDDINDFVESSYGLSLGLFNAVSNFFLYSYMLLQIAPTNFFGICNLPGWPIFLSLIYASGGSLLIQMIGSELTIQDWQLQRYNGNFRAELRWNFTMSAQLASMHAAKAQMRRLLQRFEEIKKLSWGKIRLERQLDVFEHFFGSVEAIMFTCMLLPFFIRGEVTLGNIKQCEFGLHRVRACFDFFVRSYGSLARYRACCDRLSYFQKKLLENADSSNFSTAEGLNTGSPDLSPKAAIPLYGTQAEQQQISQELAQFGTDELNDDCAFRSDSCYSESDTTASYRGGSATSEADFGSSTGPPSSVVSDAEGGENGSGEGQQALTPLTRNQMCFQHFRDLATKLRTGRVTVCLPSGQVILKHVRFALPSGTRILLCGPEGTGKSTFLRVLAGVWPFVKYEDEVCEHLGTVLQSANIHRWEQITNAVDDDDADQEQDHQQRLYNHLDQQNNGSNIADDKLALLSGYDFANRAGTSSSGATTTLRQRRGPRAPGNSSSKRNKKLTDFLFEYDRSGGGGSGSVLSIGDDIDADHIVNHGTTTGTNTKRLAALNTTTSKAIRCGNFKFFPKSLAEAESEDEEENHELHQPRNKELPYLIPQRGPGLPYPMTFREAICFPDPKDTYSDNEIYEALGKVKLDLNAKKILDYTSTQLQQQTNTTAATAGALGASADDAGGAGTTLSRHQPQQQKRIGLDTAIDVAQILSGGELQRLMIAHCLLAKPRILLLDEALVHLSQENQKLMYELLNDELVVKRKTAIVSVSHEWRSLLNVHDRYYKIDRNTKRLHMKSEQHDYSSPPAANDCRGVA